MSSFLFHVDDLEARNNTSVTMFLATSALLYVAFNVSVWHVWMWTVTDLFLTNCSSTDLDLVYRFWSGTLSENVCRSYHNDCKQHHITLIWVLSAKSETPKSTNHQRYVLGNSAWRPRITASGVVCRSRTIPLLMVRLQAYNNRHQFSGSLCDLSCCIVRLSLNTIIYTSCALTKGELICKFQMSRRYVVASVLPRQADLTQIDKFVIQTLLVQFLVGGWSWIQYKLLYKQDMDWRKDVDFVMLCVCFFGWVHTFIFNITRTMMLYRMCLANFSQPIQMDSNIARYCTLQSTPHGLDVLEKPSS